MGSTTLRSADFDNLVGQSDEQVIGKFIRICRLSAKPLVPRGASYDRLHVSRGEREITVHLSMGEHEIHRVNFLPRPPGSEIQSIQ